MSKLVNVLPKVLVVLMATVLTTSVFATDWQVQVGESITVQSIVEETEPDQYDVELTYEWPEEYLTHVDEGVEAPYTTSDDLVLQAVAPTEGQLINVDVVDVTVTRNDQTVEGNIINEDSVLVIPDAVDIRLEIQGTIEIVRPDDNSTEESSE